MKRKILTLLITICLVINCFGFVVWADDEINEVDESYQEDEELSDGVAAFVIRLYDIALDRTASSDEISAWIEKLFLYEECGVSMAYGFVYSEEFQNKRYPDDVYVDKMYDMLLGRKADSEGKAYWISNLQNGMNREDIFAGFANSQEFYNLCYSYGVVSGTYIKGIGMERNAKINGFVSRLYNMCLGRRGDYAGQAMWVSGLADGSITGVDVAFGFFYSVELNDGTCNDFKYVDLLYSVLMDRMGDFDEVCDWVEILKNTSRNNVFDGFANSIEFNNICSDYGIVKGQSQYASVPDFYASREHGNLSELEDLYQLEDEIGKKYEVTIYIGDEVPSFTYEDDNGYPCYDHDTLKAALEMIDSSFELYPIELLYRITNSSVNGFDIYLVGEIGDYAGYTNKTTYIVYRADMINSQPDTIHHELSHVIDVAIDLRYPTYLNPVEWASLNPQGFNYLGNYEDFLECDYQYNHDYFIRAYATTFMTEDLATLFEYSMTYYLFNNGEPSSLTPEILAKMKYYFDAIRKVYGSDDWPEVMPWEEILYH